MDSGGSKAIDRSYSRWISIDLRHDYASARGGLCTALAVAPTAATASRLSRFGLLVRRRRDGLDILKRTDQTAEFERLLTADRDSPGDLDRARYFGPPLLFRLEVREPEFLRFTDLPRDLGRGTAAAWFSNRSVGGADETEIELAFPWRVVQRRDPLVTADSEGGEEDAHAESRAPRFLAKGGLLSTADILSGTIERRTLLFDELPLALLDIHLTAESARVTDNGCFAVNFDGGSGGFLKKVRYQLRFAARSTYWRYIVGARGSCEPPTALSIEHRDGAAPAPFHAPQRATLPDGRSASCFDSVEPLRLQDRPEARFLLRGVTDGARRNRVLIDPLPAPHPASLAEPPRGEVPGRSDIYVYV